MNLKKQKLVNLDDNEKKKVRRVSWITFISVLLVCSILVGCFACAQDSSGSEPEMTVEQKTMYWKARLSNLRWVPMTDELNNGILAGMTAPVIAVTGYDAKTGICTVLIFSEDNKVIEGADIALKGEYGTIVLGSGDKWNLKFSEKNNVLYMTVTDENGKKVFYEGTALNKQ